MRTPSFVRSLLLSVLAALVGAGLTVSSALAAGKERVISSRPTYERDGGSVRSTGGAKAALAARRAVYQNDTGADGVFWIGLRGVTDAGARIVRIRENTPIPAGDGFFFEVRQPGRYWLVVRSPNGDLLEKQSYWIRARHDYVVHIGDQVMPPPSTTAEILMVNNTGTTWGTSFSLSSPSYLGGGELGYTFASQVPNLAVASAVPPTADLPSYTVKITVLSNPAVTVTAGAGTGTMSADSKTRTIVFVQKGDGTYGPK